MLDTVPVLLLNTFTVHTRVMSTVVSSREAQRAVSAGWAQAVKPIDLFHAGPPTHTWVGVALIYLHFTFGSF